MGFPQTIFFFMGFLSGKAVKFIFEILERSLLADPKIEFCS